jgi:hypothetical protein
MMQFVSTPRRNLIYHVWPVRGTTWRWNLDQLIARIDLFNGRRVVGVVHDERSEHPDRVVEYLDGKGCEFLIAPNRTCGECVTFPRLLGEVYTSECDEVTFYGHAKGVRYAPALPPPVRRWTEIQYAVLLDDWPGVRTQLEEFGVTGILRRRNPPWRSWGSWHYAGTFFWIRHAALAGRQWREVPTFYGGVEAWPGSVFGHDEAGCMLLDQAEGSPYLEHFWSGGGNAAYVRSLHRRRRVSVPVELARQVGSEDCDGPQLLQRPGEFSWWLEQLLHHEVGSLLVIGSGSGGVEWHVARAFRQAGRDIVITSLEASHRPAHAAAQAAASARFSQKIRCVIGRPVDRRTREVLGPRVDAVFIDGEPGYRDCAAAYALAESLGARLIALHDIVDSDWHGATHCCVSRLWNELRTRRRCESRHGEEWAGIGLVWPDPAGR